MRVIPSFVYLILGGEKTIMEDTSEIVLNPEKSKDICLLIPNVQHEFRCCHKAKTLGR